MRREHAHCVLCVDEEDTCRTRYARGVFGVETSVYDAATQWTDSGSDIV